MDFTWLIVFGALWVIVNMIRRGASKVEPGRGPAHPRRPTSSLRDAFADTSPGLRELLDAMEEARGLPRTVRLPSHSPVALPTVLDADDEFKSLESTADEVVIERAPARSLRKDVDLDDESRVIAEQRRAYAAGREVPAPSRRRAVAPEAEVADATAVAGPLSGSPLRQAMIWREILGPPRAYGDD